MIGRNPHAKKPADIRMHKPGEAEFRMHLSAALKYSVSHKKGPKNNS